MPRPKQPGAPEPKRRSRNGCWPCKGRKVKCGEEHPTCKNCLKTGDVCDYSIRLNWEGRRLKRSAFINTDPSSPSSSSSSAQQAAWGRAHAVDGCVSTTPIDNPITQRPSTSESFQPESSDGFRYELEPLGFSNTSIPVSYTERPNTSSSTTTTTTTNTTAIATPGGGAASAAFDPSRGDTQSMDEGQSKVLYTDDAQQGLARVTARRYFLRRRLANSAPLNMDLSMQTAHPAVKSPRGRHKRAKSVMGTLDSEEFDMDTSPHYMQPSGVMAESSPLMSHLQLKSIVSSPLTPGAISSYSDDVLYTSRPSERQPHQSPGPWFSVSSDNTELPVPPNSQWDVSNQYNRAGQRYGLGASDWRAGRFYGYDLGKQDEDIVKNDDANAISRVSIGMRDPSQGAVEPSLEEAFPTPRPGCYVSGAEPGFHNRGYYDQVIQVLIPWELEPLPDKLLDNPMELLYFHHFLDHTAKVLVPYHDPQSNPFRTILPKMAVENDHLLSLVLAYSASHRARLLQTNEPAMRMAQWVEDIFPALRAAVSNTYDPVSNANLATAIMLASLEIISPKAFGYAIPWQQHLNLARDMLSRRLTDLKTRRADLEEDRHCWFLWSWFIYLDVLGRFSLKPHETSSPSTWVQDFVNEVMEDVGEIDCIMGFTARCMLLLAQTAELASQCDTERIGPDRRVWPDWVPESTVLERARKLETALMESLELPSKPCRHMQSGKPHDEELAEILATNEAFHWAGIVHIQRRVLGKPSQHDDVQEPVRQMMRCMVHIRPGGTAETGFLFPMFTAGCETMDEIGRAMVLARFRNVESSGMMQVNRARKLMEKSWEQGRPWETLVENEFLG